MKLYPTLSLVLVLSAACAQGQGTFIYDQQSSTDETPPTLETGASIQGASPGMGQSFTPTLSSIGFIRLLLDDGNVTDGLGATVIVNLRSDSITGTILGTSLPVTMPPGYAGAPTFQFPSPPSVSPGTTYYFEPVVQSGGTWDIIANAYLYPGGTAFVKGSPVGSDLWFREGLAVPEPSSIALLAVSGLILFTRKPAARS